MKSFALALPLVLGCFVLNAPQALAWGERGHHTICEVATRLVKEEGLKDFLKGAGPMMGHVCNIPDISWRNLGPKGIPGYPTHYIEPEAIGLDLQTLPLSLDEIVKKSGKSRSEVTQKMGTSWWRADQFFRLALESAKKAAKDPAPANRDAEHDGELAYNRDVFNMIVNMGLMGHFIGDNSMPLHNVLDYDGWKIGHGGVHVFYEHWVVNEMPLGLDAEVFEAAEKARNETSPNTPFSVLQRMKDLSILSKKDVPEVIAQDTTLAPSDEAQHVEARRPPAAEALKHFKKLILPELGRAAALLAEFWDQVYIQAGRPNLKAYKYQVYPLDVRFVRPDYLK